MIVIAIIGILAAIIIPTFTDGGEGSVIGGPGTSINCPQ
jgi:Tfp pilus assembly protein FimT